MNAPPRVRVTLALTPALHAQLERRARRAGWALGELVEVALRSEPSPLGLPEAPALAQRTRRACVRLAAPLAQQTAIDAAMHGCDLATFAVRRLIDWHRDKRHEWIGLLGSPRRCEGCGRLSHPRGRWPGGRCAACRDAGRDQ